MPSKASRCFCETQRDYVAMETEQSQRTSERKEGPAYRKNGGTWCVTGENVGYPLNL